MHRLNVIALSVLLLLTAGMTRTAQAQFAVIDVAAVAQAIEQAITLKEQLDTLADQLETANRELEQARESHRSMTGGRGMENLLKDAPRNYLPARWEDLTSTLD